MRNFLITWVSGLLTSAAIVNGAEPLSDWKYTQTLEVAKPGIIKFSLPPETLDAARPGLEDFRIFDSSGEEIPYFLDRPLASEKVIRNPKSFNVTLNSNNTIIAIETGVSLPIDGVTLETPAGHFIKGVQIEGSNDQKSWKLIATGYPIFRQPNGANQLRLALPLAAWPFLRLTIDDRRSGPIVFSGAKIHAGVKEPELLEPLPIIITDRQESAAQSRFILKLGAAHLHLASLTIDSSEPLFTRHLTLSVQQASENILMEQSLANGAIYRVTIEGKEPISNLTLPVDIQVQNREAILTIQNNDNPPLAITAIHGHRHPLYAVFRANQPGEYRIFTGNSRSSSPRYDLTALSPHLKGLPLSPAKLSSLANNISYYPPEVLPEIQDFGTVLDVSAWKYRKKVNIERQGIQQLELDLGILSHADPSFRDLRLIRDGKQIPYILERTSMDRSFVAEATRSDEPKKPSLSRWLIKLPYQHLPIYRLVCTTHTPIFKRDMVIYEKVADSRGNENQRILGRTTWTRTSSTTSDTYSLGLEYPPSTDTLFLETDNGDNPPIELKNLQFVYPTTRILFKASLSSDVFLYYGNRQINSPRYDIDLMISQMLSTDKAAALLGSEEQLKKSAWSESPAASKASGVLFWAVLGLVVVVLLFVISRLLPKETST